MQNLRLKPHHIINFRWKHYMLSTVMLLPEELFIVHITFLYVFLEKKKYNKKHFLNITRATNKTLKDFFTIDEYVIFNEKTGFYEHTPLIESFVGLAKRKTLPRSTKKFVFNRDNGMCVYCGVKVTRNAGPEQYNCDHVVPFIKGGSDEVENLVTSCRTCNFSKGDRM